VKGLKCTAVSGNYTTKYMYGKVWQGMARYGKYGKVWESMKKYGNCPGA